MATINILGDFFISSINGLRFGDALKQELQSASLNIVNMEAPIRLLGCEPIKKSGPSLCQDPNVPTRPNNFRATINGNNLFIQKLETAIPSAQATVVNAQNGSIVVNQQFTSSLLEQIANTGVYVLLIQTAGGTLVGQFIVQ